MFCTAVRHKKAGPCTHYKFKDDLCRLHYYSMSSKGTKQWTLEQMYMRQANNYNALIARKAKGEDVQEAIDIMKVEHRYERYRVSTMIDMAPDNRDDMYYTIRMERKREKRQLGLEQLWLNRQRQLIGDIHNDQADDQRQRGHQLEIQQRLSTNTSQLAQVRHTGDPMNNREEDDGSDHHLHQIDEGVTDGLERLGGTRGDHAQQNAERNRKQNLNGEVPEEARDHVGGERGGRNLSGHSTYCLHVRDSAPLSTSLVASRST